VARRGQATGMRDGYLRGAHSPQATPRQMDVLAAYVVAGGSVTDAAELMGIRPSTVKRHPCRPSCAVGSYHRTADLQRTGWRLARRPELGAPLKRVSPSWQGKGPGDGRPGPCRACPQMRGEVSYLAGARAPEMSTTIATLITTASR